ncbi:MAG TPA: HAD-IA family hydrolase [Polyangium sp.]|nr:HAD-IA family hydrolase [Polyangium sp.]
MKPTLPRAVTFDFGQTLASFDTHLASARLAERGLTIAPERLEHGLPLAWQTYNDAIRRGLGGHPWKILMRSLIENAAPDAAAGAITDAVDFLWDQQPLKNLWRQPIPGMIELVDDLIAANVKVAVVSNSEGRLAELIEEMGWSGRFGIVADSGKLGIQKPDRGIFEWAAERLTVPLDQIVHIGDSYAADVEGALAAGMMAIWYDVAAKMPVPARCRIAHDAPTTRAALEAFGLVFRNA